MRIKWKLFLPTWLGGAYGHFILVYFPCVLPILIYTFVISLGVYYLLLRLVINKRRGT